MTPNPDIALDPQCTALIEMIGRMGASGFQLRFQDDEQPIVWIAIASFRRSAIYRLTEIFLDGGKCVHCGKGTGITLDPDDMPMADLVCWYQWDPELKTIRRGCE